MKADRPRRTVSGTRTLLLMALLTALLGGAVYFACVQLILSGKGRPPPAPAPATPP